MKTFSEKWSDICAEVDELKLENSALKLAVKNLTTSNTQVIPCSLQEPTIHDLYECRYEPYKLVVLVEWMYRNSLQAELSIKEAIRILDNCVFRFNGQDKAYQTLKTAIKIFLKGD